METVGQKRTLLRKSPLSRLSGADIRAKAKYEELDHTYLKALLREYENPNKKIHDLLADNVLIGVKRGVYVFSSIHRRQPVSLEILANMIHGPSALSLEWALSHYGLIPERVEAITSITVGKEKAYATTLGNFIYRHLPNNKYTYGIRREILPDQRPILIASPEKALCDYVVLSAKPKFKRPKDVQDFLFEDMRIDPEKVKLLKVGEIRKIARLYKKEVLFQIYDVLEDFAT